MLKGIPSVAERLVEMWQLLILFSTPLSFGLKCKDIIIGTANGTSFNFVNTLRCPTETKWCMNLNVSFQSPQFTVDGLFGNCETNGFVGSFVKELKPFVDLSCKEPGCDVFPEANLTRCCCNTDLCNTSTVLSALLLFLMTVTVSLS